MKKNIARSLSHIFLTAFFFSSMSSFSSEFEFRSAPKLMRTLNNVEWNKAAKFLDEFEHLDSIVVKLKNEEQFDDMGNSLGMSLAYKFVLVREDNGEYYKLSYEKNELVDRERYIPYRKLKRD